LIADFLAALTNPVTLTIGGAAASVLWSGLSAAGLNQLNIVVPALADGSHEVIAQITGISSQSGIVLPVQA
jgi:uncharacterized protein (TIGR03437 family)